MLFLFRSPVFLYAHTHTLISGRYLIYVFVHKIYNNVFLSTDEMKIKKNWNETVKTRIIKFVLTFMSLIICWNSVPMTPPSRSKFISIVMRFRFVSVSVCLWMYVLSCCLCQFSCSFVARIVQIIRQTVAHMNPCRIERKKCNQNRFDCVCGRM